MDSLISWAKELFNTFLASLPKELQFIVVSAVLAFVAYKYISIERYNNQKVMQLELYYQDQINRLRTNETVGSQDYTRSRELLSDTRKLLMDAEKERDALRKRVSDLELENIELKNEKKQRATIDRLLGEKNV